MKKYFCYIATLLVIASCRKDVKLDLPNYQQKIVIEGSIETGSTALVFVSYSVPYFGEFDFSTPEEAFVKGALVTVSDGIMTDTLKEIDPSVGYIYVGLKLIGKQGGTYTIRVSTGGKTFETSSTILNPVKLDTLYFDKIKGDTLGFIAQKLSEPAGSGDNYRWSAKRLGRDQFYTSPFNSVFDDKFIDGKSFNFSYNRGVQPNQRAQNSSDPERGYFKAGDTVVVKFCKIGKKEFDFWHTYYLNRSSNFNPFSSPTNIKSMFNNYQECFGAFVAYAPSFDTIIIPRE
ncbi:DUF4249 domain-containing protein [Aurantibacillus circumpalustris]|uniref:DUF4249 domain-containing protein n=1 Tax=Aurantibacillus circumpalustris TaxID=3036359 RepID=UPI00295BC66F|nr:DUF4249 domain-containing protein [Aurantibacillus circumpalustris]